MDLSQLQALLKEHKIYVSELLMNTKASEKYVVAKFIQEDGFEWETVVPYYSRWSALFLEKEQEVADYLISIKPFFTQGNMDKWKRAEWAKWKKNKGDVTKWIFKALLTFKRVNKFKLPNGSYSDNPAKRIQEIKNAGYSIASVPSIEDKKKTDRILLPIPLNNELGYEVFTTQFKNRVIRLLNGINAYEAKATSKSSLIPDHKFSEVRWDDSTREENPMSMTDSEIIAKFQLLDNQRNQQKREVCRKCFQEGIRGNIYGINYFYKGSEEWDSRIPAVGKAAEKGCEGCPWYDIEKWREMLNNEINHNSKK